MKYFIKTYGCQLNFADSEKLASLLEERDYKQTKSLADADLVIVNTCSVRQTAEDKVYGFAGQICKLKDQNPKLKAILTGCMVGSAKGERRRIKLPDLKQKLPLVDYFLTHDELIKRFSKSLKTIEELRTDIQGRRKEPALVPVMQGCDQFCSYCVVPFGRGPIKSRSVEEITEEIECLVKNGVRWVTLLGQSVNDYGFDKVKGRKQKAKVKYPFAELLHKVHEIEGLEKISFLSANPWNFPDELIEVLALPKMERFIHLPVQSGDDGILKKMNRPYTIAEYKVLIKKIRQRIPGIKIGTDIIVGFPGETEKQFQNTVKLFKELKFDVAYIAMYSERPGTAAARLYKDDIPLSEKKRRHQILLDQVRPHR